VYVHFSSENAARVRALEGAARRLAQVTATHCNKAATHCSTLQHTPAYCSILKHTVTYCNRLLTAHTTIDYNRLQHAATQCNTLQHTAASHCNNTLHHAATHCNTLQHTATHLPMVVGSYSCGYAPQGIRVLKEKDF